MEDNPDSKPKLESLGSISPSAAEGYNKYLSNDEEVPEGFYHNMNDVVQMNIKTAIHCNFKYRSSLFLFPISQNNVASNYYKVRDGIIGSNPKECKTTIKVKGVLPVHCYASVSKENEIFELCDLNFHNVAKSSNPLPPTFCETKVRLCHQVCRESVIIKEGDSFSLGDNIIITLMSFDKRIRKESTESGLHLRKYGSVYDSATPVGDSMRSSRRASAARISVVGGNEFFFGEIDEIKVQKQEEEVKSLHKVGSAKKLRFDAVAHEMDMEKNEETTHNIGNEMWNERRLHNYRMSAQKLISSSVEQDLSNVIISIYNRKDKSTVSVNVTDKSRITIGSHEQCGLCIPGENDIAPFQARLYCDYGAVWLCDLSGKDYSTLFFLTRPFPIQLSDVIMLKQAAFHVIQEESPLWYAAAIVAERLRQSRRQSFVSAEHAKLKVWSLPRLGTHSVGYSEKCDVCCRDSEMGKEQFRIICGTDDRFFLACNAESRLKYTALLVGRKAKRKEILSWYREINQSFEVNPGDEIIIGRTTFQVRCMKVESEKLMMKRNDMARARSTLLQNIKFLAEMPISNLDSLSYLALSMSFKKGEEIEYGNAEDEQCFYVLEKGEAVCEDNMLKAKEGDYWGFNEFFLHLENPNKVIETKKYTAQTDVSVIIITSDMLIKSVGSLAHLPVFCSAVAMDKNLNILSQIQINNLGKVDSFHFNINIVEEECKEEEVVVIEKEESIIKLMEKKEEGGKREEDGKKGEEGKVKKKKGIQFNDNKEVINAFSDSVVMEERKQGEVMESSIQIEKKVDDKFEAEEVVAVEVKKKEEEHKMEEEEKKEEEEEEREEPEAMLGLLFSYDEEESKSAYQIDCERRGKETVRLLGIPEFIEEKKFFISLEAMGGPQRGMLWHSDAFITTIGKQNGGSMIGLLDKSVSNRHAQLEYVDGRYFLRDLNSTSGTFMKMHSDVKQQLHCGDIFQGGNTEFTILGLESDGRSMLSGCCSLV